MVARPGISGTLRVAWLQHANPGEWPPLLRVGSEGGHEETQHQGHEERKSFHRITSSAWKRSVGGMVRPSSCAVLRLTTSSNVSGRSTGSSAGGGALRNRT